ncbi:hypothetical protein [Burkholderia stagnalis]|uniref:hypothetical protein n=1 Tax=Burkholderia stagnalis TaxID=1503054 RepID=UPI0012DA447C|nr:hypothetical protein [Burkholderia stagnalis]
MLDAAARAGHARGRTKQLLNASLSRTLPEQRLAEQERSPSARRMSISNTACAFVDKRKPRFEGR